MPSTPRQGAMGSGAEASGAEASGAEASDAEASDAEASGAEAGDHVIVGEEVEEQPEDIEEFSESLASRGLHELARSRAALDELERALVLTARVEGQPWWRIAESLGVTKPTVLRRHRAADPVTAARERALAADPWLQELAELRALRRRTAREPNP